MLGIIILFISIYLDGLLTLFLPYIPNNLSIIFPMFTLVSLLIIYPLYRKKEKQYFITSFIVGIIYDLLYTNLLFYNALVFLLFAFIIKWLYKNFDVRHIKITLYTTIMIILYELLLALIILVFNLVPITIPKLIYKITHTLLINIVYAESLYEIIKLLPKKYKRIDIN